MKRKLPVLLAAAVMAAALVLPAFADVIWEPNNNFYESHRYECSYENRNYLTNGQKGYITLRTAPDSLVEVVNVVNGVRLTVGFTWQAEDGETWAVGDYAVQEEGQTWKWYTGWVSMDELALIYDYIAFEEDHNSEFQDYDGSGDELTEAYLYSYPNGRFQMLLVEAKEYMPFAETFQNLYTDENGLRWTFVGYYMGSRNAWICIDDPLNEDLGVDEPRTVAQVRGGAETIVPAAEQAPDGPDGVQECGLEDEELIPPAEKVPAAKTYVTWLVPAALIVAVVAVTAVVVRRRNRSK